MYRRLIPLAIAIVLVIGCKKKRVEDPEGKLDSDPDATFTLKIRDEQKGDKAEIIETQTGTSEINFAGKGDKEKQDKKLTYTEEIHEMTPGSKPTKLTRTYTVAQKFDKKSGTMKSLPYEGKTIAIEKKAANYEFAVAGKKMSFLDSADLMGEFAKQDRGSLDDLMPKKPVKVGESWTVDWSALKSIGGDMPFAIDKTKSTLTGKLTRAYTKDGKQWGVITFDMNLAIDPAAAKGKGTATGSVKANGTFDVVIDGSSRDGTLKMNLNMNVTGKEGAMEAKIVADMVQEKTVKTLK